MYKYYGSAPTTRKTSINSTMQLLALFDAFALGRFIIYSFFIHILTGPTKQLFTDYPNFMCSLTSDRYSFYLFYVAMNSVFVLRCLMKLRPLYFVDLNHEIIQKVVLSICVFFVIFELSFSLIKHKTFCPISYISVLNALYDFDLDNRSIPLRQSTPLLKIMGMIGFCAEITPIIVKKWKKWKSPRNISVPPTYTINLPTTSTSNLEVTPPNPVSITNLGTNYRYVSAITPVDLDSNKKQSNLNSTNPLTRNQTLTTLTSGTLISVNPSASNYPNSTQLNTPRGPNICSESLNTSDIVQSASPSSSIGTSSSNIYQIQPISEMVMPDTTSIERTAHLTPNFSTMACLVPPGYDFVYFNLSSLTRLNISSSCIPSL